MTDPELPSGLDADSRGTLALTAELVSRPSLTPDDAGCQQLLAARLAAVGFACEHLRYGDTDNLLAIHGHGGPLLLLVGHTDVVPPGPLARWTSPPFAPTVRDGRLYGRGAADMKASVAAMCLALEDLVATQPTHAGRVGLLMTSDEEGPARDGIVRVVEALEARGERIDLALVGEPSSDRVFGDRVRIGRRGSLHACLTVHGVQGHVAYPDKADNPIHRAAAALADLAGHVFDAGNDHFPPSSFQIYEISAGVPGSNNVIPGELKLAANWRYGTASTPESLEAQLRALLDRHGLRYTLAMRISSLPFLTERTGLRQVLQRALLAETGHQAVEDTGGGTSDGRFLAPHGAAVVEFGPINASIHQVDEHIALTELGPLRRIYRTVLEAFVADPAALLD